MFCGTLLQVSLTCYFELKSKVIHYFLLLHKIIITILSSQVTGALSGLREFLATESPLKIIKIAFYFTSKVLSVLKIF